MLEMLFLRSWVSAMVCTIIMMALSIGVKARVLFLEWLDHLEVGVTPKGQPPHRLAVKAVMTVKL